MSERLNGQGRDRHRRGIGHRQGQRSSCSGSEGATVVGADIGDGADRALRRRQRSRGEALIERRSQRARPARHLLRQRRHLGRLRLDLAEQTADDWAEILRVNLIGPFLAIKHAAPAMAARAAGLDHLHRECRGPCARAPAARPIRQPRRASSTSSRPPASSSAASDIRVNAICPGLIETGMTGRFYDVARDARPGATASASSTRSARRRARGDREGRAVPRLRRQFVRQRPCAGRRRRPVFKPSDGSQFRLQDA